MAALDPEFQMDTGSPDQLPKGAAQDLNQAASSANQALAQQAEPAAAPLPQYKTAKPDTSTYLPTNEDDALLYGPTARPNEPITTGAAPAGIASKQPPDMEKWYPALVEASRSPDAPPLFKEMLALIQHHLGA